MVCRTTERMFLQNSTGVCGGAIAADGALTATNSTFTQNNATAAGGGDGDDGGAIYTYATMNFGGSSGSTFTKNSAINGGAVYLGCGSNESVDALRAANTFSRNLAPDINSTTGCSPPLLMGATYPTLIIVEVPPEIITVRNWLRRGMNASMPLHQTGHFLEQAEGLAAAWPGEVVFILPPGGRHSFAGVARTVDVVTKVSVWRAFLFKHLFGRGLQIAHRLGLRTLVTYFTQKRLEAVQDPAVAEVLVAELEKHQDAVVICPSAWEHLCESIVRSSARLNAAANRRVRVIVCWHYVPKHRRIISSAEFGKQLHRWKQRAPEIDLVHVAHMESSAKEWSVEGHVVNWLPYPLNPSPSVRRTMRVAPEIYLFSTREEQGSSHLEDIIRSLRSEIQSNLSITLRTNRVVAAKLRASTLLAESDGSLTIATKEPAGLLAFWESVKGRDVAILPYKLAPYQSRGSGALLNLLAARVPVVVPSGTGLGDLVAAEGVGMAYEQMSQIPELVKSIIANSAQYQVAIERYLQKHQGTFTATLRAFGTPDSTEDH